MVMMRMWIKLGGSLFALLLIGMQSTAFGQACTITSPTSSVTLCLGDTLTISTGTTSNSYGLAKTKTGFPGTAMTSGAGDYSVTAGNPDVWKIPLDPAKFTPGTWTIDFDHPMPPNFGDGGYSPECTYTFVIDAPVVNFTYPALICENQVGSVSPTGSGFNPNTTGISPATASWTFTGWTTSPVGFSTTNGNIVPGSVNSVNIGVPITAKFKKTTAAGCSDSLSRTFTITAQDDPFFNFPGSPFCVNDPDPGPGTVTTPGGDFYSPSSNLIVDQSTGVVDLSATPTPNNNNRTLRYVTGGSCPDSAEVQIRVRDVRWAEFEYLDSLVCKPTSGTLNIDPSSTGPTFDLNSNQDTWSYDTITGGPPISASLSLNTGSGRINVTSSDFGRYRVNRVVDPESGGQQDCGDSYSFIVQILEQDTSNISYPQDTFCLNFGQALITVNSGTGGSNVFADTSGLLALDLATGNIDSFNTTPPGYYEIFYSKASGSCPAADTFGLWVLPMDVANFSYPAPQYCINDAVSDIATVPPSSATGIFGGTGLTINSGDGEIDLTTTGIGNYWVTYTTNEYCPNIDSFPIEIFRESAAFHYDTTRFCELDNSMPQPIIDGTGGGRFFDPSGVLTFALDSASGRINLSGVNQTGFHTIRYISGGTCIDSLDLAIEIVAKDSVTFQYAFNQACYLDDSLVVSARADSSVGGRFMSFIPGDTALVIDSVSGTIDLQATPAGYYAIKYVSAGLCPDSTFRIIQVFPRKTIAIDYVQDRYCKQDNNPVPAATGTGAGTGYFYCPDPDIEVDSINGEIDLAASLTGMYIVEYHTSSPCSEVAIDTVYIDDQARVEWNFPNNIAEFCVSDANPIPELDSLSDTTGRWTVSNAALVFIDSLTGEIFLNQSQPNDTSNSVYVLTYSVAGGANSCPSIKARTFTIATPDSLSFFDYDTTGTQGQFDNITRVCKSRSARFAAIFGPDANRSGYFTADTTDLVFTDGFTIGGEVRSFTGSIDLAATPDGTYLVTYNLAGTCITAPTHTIVVLPADDLRLTVPNSFYCRNLPDPLLSTDSSSRSTALFDWFSNVPGTGANLVLTNFIPGQGIQIDLSASTEGSYTVFYYSDTTIAACPDTASIQVTLGDVPTPQLASDAIGNAICDNDTIVIEVGNLNVFDHDFYWHLDTLPSSQLNQNTTAEFQLVAVDPANGSEFIVIAEDRDNGCRDTVSLPIIVHPIPDGVIDRVDSVISSDRPVEVDMLSDAPSTVFHYCMVPSSNLQPDTTVCDSSGQINTGQVATLGEDFVVQGNFVPASVTVYITPIAFGCVGETDSVTIKLNPSDQDVFIPGIITPNGDGFNDYWKIQVKSGIPLDQYSLVLLNRSGGIAYEMPALEETWTPNSLPDGVYWWVLKRADSNEVVRRGGLTIRRK